MVFHEGVCIQGASAPPYAEKCFFLITSTFSIFLQAENDSNFTLKLGDSVALNAMLQK